jgi:hypothetical protein
MADSLTIDQKYEYCEHKEAVQKQGNKFPCIVALEILQEQPWCQPQQQHAQQSLDRERSVEECPSPEALKPKRLGSSADQRCSMAQTRESAGAFLV